MTIFGAQGVVPCLGSGGSGSPFPARPRSSFFSTERPNIFPLWEVLGLSSFQGSKCDRMSAACFLDLSTV
jgi:hypothetical protein